MSTHVRELVARPAASVLMPVRGSRNTLPLAVASVLAQTFGSWELLIVQDDDGVGLEWLAALGDPRIRVLRARGAGGRGAARQAGLEAARGEWLCFLDADDWMYPDRLERQVRGLQRDSSLALVSGGMAVEDRAHRPFGRRRSPGSGDRPRTFAGGARRPPILSASSMVRTEWARAVGYDVRLEWSEDLDFFHRYLHGRRFLFDPVPVYCYREFDSFSRASFRRCFSSSSLVQDRWRRAPLSRAAFRARRLGQRLAYEAAFATLGDERVVARRSVTLSAWETERHRLARRRVEETLAGLTAHAAGGGVLRRAAAAAGS